MPKFSQRISSACATMILTAGALALTATAPAVAAPVDNPTIDPVGYNIVNGVQDQEHPITVADITKDTGSSSTPSSLGTHPILEQDNVEEKIIEGDSRTQVTTTTEAPFRWVGLITYTTQAGGTGRCTGSLVAADTVVTAGHCLNKNGSNITFTPGQNGADKRFRTAKASQVWYDKTGSAAGHDWGVIKLETPIGSDVGWFGMRTPEPGSLNGSFATVIGYPGDKPFGTMWKGRNKILKANKLQAHYSADTSDGESGASIVDDTAIIYGIHTSGTNQQNWGTLLTGELFNTIVNISKREVKS